MKNGRPTKNRSLAPIGSIMRTYGLSVVDLQEALRFQLVHKNLLLGDICVLLGYIPRWVRNAAVEKQEAATSGPLALMRLAEERTHRLNAAIGDLTQRVRGLAEKGPG